MRRISTFWIASMLIVAAASISRSKLIGQATSVTVQEPPTLGELFYADKSTGALSPLEHVKPKRLAGRIQSGGFLQPRVQRVELYFQGGCSSVAYKAGQPVHFLVRLMSPADRYGQKLTKEEVSKHFALGRLVVQDVKNQEARFLTKAAVPLDVEAIGAPKFGLDLKHPEREAQSFLLTPTISLTPGEYQIWTAGTHDYELVANSLVGEEHWAFDIVAR